MSTHVDGILGLVILIVSVLVMFPVAIPAAVIGCCVIHHCGIERGKYCYTCHTCISLIAMFLNGGGIVQAL